MAIWKDPTPAAKANEPARFDLASSTPAANPEPAAPAPVAPSPVRAVETAARESVIAADLAIEGKIHCKVVETAPDEESTDVLADAAINAAALLILGHLHANRGGESVEIPQAALWLLQPYWNFAGGV